MKHLIILASIMAPAVSLAMENLPPYITIINYLPIANANLSSNQIDISDTIKLNYRYNNRSYAPDNNTIVLYSNQGTKFSPRTHKTLHDEYKRFGMNNARDTALIALYVHAAITKPLIHLIVGKGSPIQFGDTITFTTQSDDTIILNHNAKEFAQIKTKEIIRIIPEPKFLGDCIAIQLTQNSNLRHYNKSSSSDSMDKSFLITIINELPANDPHFPSAKIDVSEKTKYNVYTNKSYSPDESTITISCNETKQFPLNIDETNSTSITFHVHDAIEDQLFQLNIGKGSRVKCGDTITLTPKFSNTIVVKHNNSDKKRLITLNTTQSAHLIGLPHLTANELLKKYGCEPQHWFNDFPYIQAIYSHRFAKENL